MRKLHLIMSGMAAASALALASPAMAGKHDRAEQAIAEAQGKIDAANKVGASGAAPHTAANAEASLKIAREALKSGHKEDAIRDAIHASQLADVALGEAQRGQAQANAAQADATAAAQQQAANANARADAAQQTADSAQQSAAAAQADAAAARATPPVIVAAAPTPAPATTVTTETTKTVPVRVATAKPATHKVVRRTVVAHPVARQTETTKTTVTTTPQ